MEQTGVVLRPWDPGKSAERAFVYDSWIKSYRDRVCEIPRSWYAKLYNSILDRLLQRPKVSLFLACPVGAPDTFLGFVAFEVEPGGTPVVHFLYVKQIYRSLGNFLIPRMLFKQALNGRNRFFYTWKPSNNKLTRYLGGVYRPEFIRRQLP